MSLNFEDQVTQVIMSAIKDLGFAISGGRAALIHNIVDRPTEDLDAFSNQITQKVVPEATKRILDVLSHNGFIANLKEEFSNELFSRIEVQNKIGLSMKVDLGYDWRQYPTVQSRFGPVIDLKDLAANKMSVLWLRREVRDVIDVYGLLNTGHFTRSQLLSILKNTDEGFNEKFLIKRLDAIQEHTNQEFIKYGLTSVEAENIRTYFAKWSEELKR